MENKRKIILLNKKGQSIVEYLLLLAVVGAFITSVLNSDAFRGFIGPDSDFFDKMRRKMEYSYRYGDDGFNQIDGENNVYFNPERGESRFFSPTSPFP